jgi:hypothetical protein
VLLAALMVLPVSAQETGAACGQVENDIDRLACYDKLFRPDNPPLGGGALTILSERLIPALPSGRKPAEMIVSCDAGLLTVQFRFAGQLVSATGDIAPLTLQVDQNATAVRTLRVSEDNTALGFWTTSESQAFLNSLAGGTSLKVRMTPVRQRSLTVDFRLPDHRDAIVEVRGACE